MKIQEAAVRTGLTKKAIHFYINEGLIQPIKLENNYHDFSEDDIEKLLFIAKLRHIGLSIKDINEMLLYPNLTNFFLHRHVNELKEQVNLLTSQLSDMQYMIEQLPPLATPTDLKNKSGKERIREEQNIVDSLFPANNARMVAILFWGSFLKVEASEYRKYLWNRISTELEYLANDNVNLMSRLLYSLSAEQIDLGCKDKYIFDTSIINMNHSEICELVVKQMQIMIHDTKQQAYWKLLYTNVLIPLFELYSSEANNLMKEYNPTYGDYYNKLKNACEDVSHNTKHQTVCEELNSVLGTSFCVDRYDGCELLMLVSFSKSIFMKLDLDICKELLCKAV